VYIRCSLVLFEEGYDFWNLNIKLAVSGCLLLQKNCRHEVNQVAARLGAEAFTVKHWVKWSHLLFLRPLNCIRRIKFETFLQRFVGRIIPLITREE
jgi:hypothetical protein